MKHVCTFCGKKCQSDRIRTQHAKDCLEKLKAPAQQVVGDKDE